MSATQSQTTAPSLLGLEDTRLLRFSRPQAEHAAGLHPWVRVHAPATWRPARQRNGPAVPLPGAHPDRPAPGPGAGTSCCWPESTAGSRPRARPFRPATCSSTWSTTSAPRASVRFAGDVDREVVGDAELVAGPSPPGRERAHLRPAPSAWSRSPSTPPEGTSWEVHDGGFRLTNERISQLFRPFTRSDEPVERWGSGAGLGLTLPKAYAQVLLSGEVGGRADEHGTVFWVKVPAPAAEGHR